MLPPFVQPLCTNWISGHQCYAMADKFHRFLQKGGYLKIEIAAPLAEESKTLA